METIFACLFFGFLVLVIVSSVFGIVQSGRATRKRQEYIATLSEEDKQCIEKYIAYITSKKSKKNVDEE